VNHTSQEEQLSLCKRKKGVLFEREEGGENKYLMGGVGSTTTKQPARKQYNK
jgi:hypothetical protein